MKELIYEKIAAVENLKERALLKELMNGVFMALYEHNETMYNQLERRVFDEIPYEQQSYSLYTSLVSKEDYDPLHAFLHPMLPQDVLEESYDLQAILTNIKDGKKEKLFKIFLECEYLKFQGILNDNQLFQGVIKTDKRSYDAYFEVAANKDYWDEVEKLYTIFISNNIPWKTINVPYISRILDVCLIKIEEGIGDDENIQEIMVDFGQHSQFIRYNQVPLWNIKKIILDTIGFPMPCQDHIHYEHGITIREYGTEHGYLVQDVAQEIQYVRHQKENIVIVSSCEEAKKWPVYMVTRPKSTKIVSPTYPVISNAKKVSFIEKLQSTTATTIKTKAELMRMVEAFEVGQYIQLQDVEVMDNSFQEGTVVSETYSMNPFIEDEIRDQSPRKKLVLLFTTQHLNLFIIRDILSFLVSEIQLYYPEYYCEGRLG
ncbi:MAG: hypothetical protein AB9856_06985 [Cellulosilyticaceae bacterium]